MICMYIHFHLSNSNTYHFRWGCDLVRYGGTWNPLYHLYFNLISYWNWIKIFLFFLNLRPNSHHIIYFIIFCPVKYLYFVLANYKIMSLFHAGVLFFSYMIEDRTPGGLSYVEFLVHVHRQIQTKMSWAHCMPRLRFFGLCKHFDL